ncbi:MAG: hypothetical protein BGO76_04620 [Caedibacter sp. 38-128]|nr:MAG: hypothetical protein BGO76_04620 [Caedibacter sp. 38-128]
MPDDKGKEWGRVEEGSGRTSYHSIVIFGPVYEISGNRTRVINARKFSLRVKDVVKKKGRRMEREAFLNAYSLDSRPRAGRTKGKGHGQRQKKG